MAKQGNQVTKQGNQADPMVTTANGLASGMKLKMGTTIQANQALLITTSGMASGMANNGRRYHCFVGIFKALLHTLP